MEIRRERQLFLSYILKCVVADLSKKDNLMEFMFRIRQLVNY
jgi:hypothetical protein